MHPLVSRAGLKSESELKIQSGSNKSNVCVLMYFQGLDQFSNALSNFFITIRCHVNKVVRHVLQCLLETVLNG